MGLVTGQRALKGFIANSGQRQQLDDKGVGQALFLVTGLPPFLRCKDLRAKNRGELLLGCKG